MRNSLRVSVFVKIIGLITMCSIMPMVATVAMQFMTYHRVVWSVIFGVMALSITTLLAAYALARHLTRPISALMGSVKHIAQGDFSPVPVPGSYDELQELSIAFNKMVEDLRRFGKV